MRNRLIRLLDEGWVTETETYELAAESYLDQIDEWRTRAKENGYRNPLVAPLFCVTCNWSENAHPRPECFTGFIPGKVEDVIARNKRLGFDFD